MRNLTPREIVAHLDRYIVGQHEAKRAVAVAVRNRWRRQQLPEDIRQEVSPKNILMIGPTGVGKTEIARRLARLTGAPFVKVEATKFTEVGYYGRDVESIIRELVENAISLVREQERRRLEPEVNQRVEERLLELLCPEPPYAEEEEDFQRHERNRQRMQQMLRDGKLEDRKVEITLHQKAMPMMVTGMGMEQLDMDLSELFEKLMPGRTTRREVTVKEARKLLFEEELDQLINKEEVHQKAIQLAEDLGIVFLDEIDKIVASDSRGPDVSRQGVQRDLLPIVEGTTVNTRYGHVRTDHILFIAAGAFHRTSPSELMPELQGRFPIRVELSDLTREDFIRILTEPQSALTRQYQALLSTEGVTVEFTQDAIEELADYAYRVNQKTQNIGARRLYTIMERLLEELSFEASEMSGTTVQINAAYVEQRLDEVAQDEDLSKFIL